MMTVTAFDPGKSGSMSNVGNIPAAVPLPYLDGELDTEQIAEQLRLWSPDLVLLEAFIPMPGHRPSDYLTIGKEWGRIYERVRVMGYPLEIVTPNAWTKGLGQPTYPKTLTAPKRQRMAKEWRIVKCKELFPNIEWDSKFDVRGGQADALLMAWTRLQRVHE